MTTAPPAPKDVLEKVDTLGPLGTPVTTPEVADGFDCTQRTIYNRLETLVDDGVLKTKKVGANSRVWWRPVDGDIRRNDGAVDQRVSITLRERQELSFLSDSEMAKRIREFEWAKTPLGPITEWPLELRVAVDIMLGASEAICIYWGEHYVLLYNDAWQELIGDKHPEALGQPARDVFPEIWETTEPKLTDVLDGNRAVVEREHRLPLAHNGQVEDAWFDYSYNPIPMADGSVGGIFDITTEVTERKQHEEALRESQERLDAFVTATSDVVYRMSPDWSEMYYLDGQEFIPDTDEPRQTWLEEYIPVDERPRVTEAIQEAIETKSTFELEHQVVQVDGTRGWTHSRAVPLLDDNGEIAEWFGTATDITERKRAQQQLGEERDMFADGPAVVFRWEPDEEAGWPVEYVSENVEDVLGYTPEEFESGAVLYTDILLEEELDWIAREVTEHSDGSTERFSHEPYRVRTKDGDVRWVKDVTNIVRDDDSEIENYLGYLIDITERKRQEESLRELQEISTELIQEDDIGNLADRVLDAAVEIVDADFASFQLYNPDQDILELVAHRGFNEEAKSSWAQVRPEDGSTCAEALQTGERIIVSDIETCEFMAGTEDREIYLQTGIRAAQTTPLISRSGDVLGMFSTHWADQRDLSDRDLSHLDVLARQAADLIEHQQTMEALRESEATLERLNVATQELIDAETATIADRVAPLVRDVLDVEFASLWRYDDRSGDLEEYAADAAPDVDVRAVDFPTEIPDQVWETFVGTDVDVENDLDVPTDATAPLRSRAFVPLGRHGVVCLGSTRADTFDERTVDLLETVAATVETAWDRAAGEQELARRNDDLTRLDRLNTLIREIDQALVTAGTREEIDDAVCERLADSNLYEFAWIGAFDADADAARPRSWAGVDGSTVENLAVASNDTGVAPDPFVTAIRTREMQVIEDIATDMRTGPWREVALKCGARSCFNIPLTYDDSVYGVLVVYGGSPAQHHRDTDVLAELGRTIAHAINAIETRDTFQADSVVELTLRSMATDTPLCRLSQVTGSELEFEGLVPGTDDVAILFFSVSGVASKQVVAAGEDVLGIEELTPLTDREDCTMFRARMSDPTLASRVLAQNATVRSLRIDAGTATVVVDLPGSTSVRGFVDDLTQEVPDLELLSRRTRTREPGATLQTAVLDRLTPRQQEVLQLAYRSGYFEMPRDQTGKELADALGIVPSTFTKHIRNAERNLLDVIFVDGHELPEPGAK
ncbi:GAF domain-containing protein [Natrialbaceae archaeon A-gly3]